MMFAPLGHIRTNGLGMSQILYQAFAIHLVQLCHANILTLVSYQMQEGMLDVDSMTAALSLLSFLISI